MCFQKQPETRFYDRSLGTSAAAAHGLMHQLVIDLDIGSHEGGLSMCNSPIFVCIRSNRKNRHSTSTSRFHDSFRGGRLSTHGRPVKSLQNTQKRQSEKVGFGD
jgi:hypothetical protein